MNTVKLSTDVGPLLRVKTGERKGVLGKLGISEQTGVLTAMCPECGRLQLYADIDKLKSQE